MPTRIPMYRSIVKNAHRWQWPIGLALLTAAGGARLLAKEGISRHHVVAAANPAADDPYGSADGAAKPSERLREGTRLTDEVGAFENVGDRISFQPAGRKDSFRVLENLALERISRSLDEGGSLRQWVVSGVVTEFRGANYLIVSKAAIRAQQTTPVTATP